MMKFMTGTVAAAAILMTLVSPLTADKIGPAIRDVPIFDAHIHYKEPAWGPYPVKTVIEMMDRSGVAMALVSSTPDEGTINQAVGICAASHRARNAPLSRRCGIVQLDQVRRYAELYPWKAGQVSARRDWGISHSQSESQQPAVAYRNRQDGQGPEHYHPCPFRCSTSAAAL